jgi:hypothetical protein
MKKILVWTLLVIPVLVLIGCDENDSTINRPLTPPAAPQGVYSVTGDQAVYVYWNGIYDSNVKEYLVWRSLQRTTGYTQIATVLAESNPNLDLIIYHYVDSPLVNGTTYYYAVSSVNNDNKESDLSAEDVYDTPRPEGAVILYPRQVDASLSGFNFATAHQVYDTSRAADIFVDTFQSTYYINAANAQTDIQDMGFTSNFTDIGFAPDSGWSALGFLELVKGHTYVIWTSDSHYAKMRLVSFNPSGSLTFQWAYQTAANNLELSITHIPGPKKPIHGPDYLIKTADNTRQNSAR